MTITSIITVSVLIIEHKHGRNISVHGSDETALDAVFAYVKERWGREMGGKPMPDTEHEAITDYFEETGETWDVSEHALENAQWIQPAAFIASAVGRA